MVFLEEWVNGMPPGKLEYLPGIQPAGLTPDDPEYLDRIIYKDPVFNLPFGQQLLLREAEESLRKGKKMRVVVKREDEILCQSGEADKGEEKPELLLDSGRKSSSDQPIVVPLPSGEMRCKIGDKEVTLANFSVKAVEHQIWLRPDRPKEGESKFVIRLLTQGKTQDILLGVRDIENVIGVIQRKMPECYVNPSVGKAQILVSNYIRDQLGSLPERLYIGKSGFIKIHETRVFAHDGAIFSNPDVVFRTGRTIARKPEMTPKEAFQAAMGFLEVSGKDAMIIPLFLVAHLSPMFNLFSAAGHIPRFVTFLSGRTGSMKTSLSLALFRLFQEQLSSPEASFKDTETALEIKLGEGNGKVILLDDYRLPVTAQDGKWESGYLTKREAERALRSRIEAVETSSSNNLSCSTVCSFLNYWLDNYCAQNLAPNTFRGYRTNVEKHICPIIGEILLVKLTPKHIQDLYSELLRRGLSGTSVRYVHNNLHKAFDYGVKLQALPRNPAEMVTPPRAERFEANTLTPTEVVRLLETSRGTEVFWPILLAVSLGLRRGEVLALRWKDVDLDARQVFIRHSARCENLDVFTISETKTKSSRRLLCLPAYVADALRTRRELLEERRRELGATYNEQDLVCFRETGTPFT